MRLTKSLVAVLTGLVVVFAFPLVAQKENPEQCGKGCGIPNLTPEQTAKIQKLKIEHQKAMLLLQTDLKTKRLDLRQLMMEGADQKKLEAKIDEIAKVSADIQKKCLVHRNDILSLLTDEQKKAMNQKCSCMDCGVGFGHGAGCGIQGSGGCNKHACGDHKMSKMRGCGHGEKGCASKGECAKK